MQYNQYYRIIFFVLISTTNLTKRKQKVVSCFYFPITISKRFNKVIITQQIKTGINRSNNDQGIFGLVTSTRSNYQHNQQNVPLLMHSIDSDSDNGNLKLKNHNNNDTTSKTVRNSKTNEDLFVVNLERSLKNKPSTSSDIIKKSLQFIKDMIFQSRSNTNDILKQIVNVGSTYSASGSSYYNSKLYTILNQYLSEEIWIQVSCDDTVNNETSNAKLVRIISKDEFSTNTSWKTSENGIWIHTTQKNNDTIIRELYFEDGNFIMMETSKSNNQPIQKKRYTMSLYKPLLSQSTQVNGCVSTVYIQTLLLPIPNKNEQQYYKVFVNGTSDALLSRGFISILSNLFVCLNEKDILQLQSNTITDDLGIRDVLSKGRNDGIANIVTIAQDHIQTLSNPLNTTSSTNLPINELLKVKTSNELKSIKPTKNVAMLLSGGVDSSVALHLLHNDKDINYNITAFYLKIWLEDELSHLNQCPWEDDIHTCQLVCQHILPSSNNTNTIPLQLLSLQNEYKEYVLNYTIQQAKMGLTPNPDIMCNSRIKFGVFLDYINNNYKDEHAFDYIATGHYAQVFRTKDMNNNTIHQLHRSKDDIKDQSYFLSTLTQNQLSKLIFPIGKYTKDEIRYIAQNIFELPNAYRKDSQGLCFLGKVSFNDFLHNYLSTNHGIVQNIHTKETIGNHNGLWYHTIGQRKGMGKVLFPNVTNLGPWFVVGKDIQNNILFVSNQYNNDDDNNEISKSRINFMVDKIHWIHDIEEESSQFSSKEPQRYFMKIRHGPTITKGTFYPSNYTSGKIILDAKDKGLAPGQFVVFYKMEQQNITQTTNEIDTGECLGAGVICEKHWEQFIDNL